MRKRLTLKDLKTDVSILQGEINVLKADIEEIKTEIMTLKSVTNDVIVLMKEVNDLDEKLKFLENEVVSVKADIREFMSAYTEDILTINTRIDRLEQKAGKRGIVQCIRSLLKK